jgi:hypothetical protein
MKEWRKGGIARKNREIIKRVEIPNPKHGIRNELGDCELRDFGIKSANS